MQEKSRVITSISFPLKRRRFGTKSNTHKYLHKCRIGEKNAVITGVIMP